MGIPKLLDSHPSLPDDNAKLYFIGAPSILLSFATTYKYYKFQAKPLQNDRRDYTVYIYSYSVELFVNIAELTPVIIHSQITLPLLLHSYSAGFESPVDAEDKGMDLNDYLIRRPDKTFYARACGEAMRDYGIFDGDLLIVDRDLKPNQGDLVIALQDGELLCRELDLRNSLLTCKDPDIPALSLDDNADLRIEGVIISAVREFR